MTFGEPVTIEGDTISSEAMTLTREGRYGLRTFKAAASYDDFLAVAP